MFKNKVILITGATGTAGSDIVRTFLLEGAFVVGISRSSKNPEQIKNTKSVKQIEPFFAVSGDFTNDSEVAKGKVKGEVICLNKWEDVNKSGY